MTRSMSAHDSFQGRGSVIQNRYLVQQLLGAGAMGSVYWASDCRDKRAVAIKIGCSDDHFLCSRFRREVALQRRIRHPGVPSVLAEGEMNGRPFIVFPYIDGRTIEAVADSLPGEKLHPSNASWVMIEVCKALSAAHLAAVVHRDVKPANAMCDANGVIRLIDFGLSIGVGSSTGYQAVPEDEDGTLAPVSGSKRLTGAESALGTPAYISPEQAVGRDRAEVTPLSDIYSAGCSLFTLVTGRLPFEYESEERMLRAHVEEEIPDPRRYAPEVPKPLALVIRKAAARRPQERYGSAHELLRNLQRYGAPQPLPPNLIGGLTPEQIGGSTAHSPAVA